MKLFIISFVVVAVAADRLENTYLPPSSAQSAGGNGNFLSAPGGNRYQAPSTNYAAPSSNSNGNGNGNGNGNNYNQQAYNNNGQQQNQPGPDAGAAILKFENENNGDGSYHFEYETDNQIQHQEAGELKNVGGGDAEAQSVTGSYSYMGPDGVLYTVNYIADENGFRATGDHIPTAPPVPEAIQKSLELNAAAEAAGSSNQGYTNGGYQNGNGNGNGNHQANSNNGYKYNSNNGNNGYQNGNGNGNGHHGASSAQPASRQYIPPNNKPSFNQQNGYQY